MSPINPEIEATTPARAFFRLDAAAAAATYRNFQLAAKEGKLIFQQDQHTLEDGRVISSCMTVAYPHELELEALISPEPGDFARLQGSTNEWYGKNFAPTAMDLDKDGIHITGLEERIDINIPINNIDKLWSETRKVIAGLLIAPTEVLPLAKKHGVVIMEESDTREASPSFMYHPKSLKVISVYLPGKFGNLNPGLLPEGDLRDFKPLVILRSARPA